jgi:hypothetical protein
MTQKQFTRKIKYILFIATLIPAGFIFAGGNLPKHKSADKQISTELSTGAGMPFIQNKGQIIDMDGKLRPDVLYKAFTNSADIYVRKTGVSYVRSDINEVMHEIDEQIEEQYLSQNGEKAGVPLDGGNVTKVERDQLKREAVQKAIVKIHRLDVDFAGANLNPEVQTYDQADGYTNYYYAHCPQGITHVNSYNQITVKNIYNNIDVKYYSGKQQGLKYDIVVNPGADPNQIKLKYTGHKNIEIKNGNLRIETAMGAMEESLPKVYQLINGKTINITAEYKLTSTRNKNNTAAKRTPENLIGDETVVTFELGTWNPKFPLVIDPFVWATYYGGNKNDYPTSLAVDAAGNTIITGGSESTNFPTGASAGNTVFQGANGGFGYDAFVVKFSPTGTRLWATCYGGSSDEWGYSVTTDLSGNIAITGNTGSTNFPVGGTVFQAAKLGPMDAFAVKFDATGIRSWATYYGGSNYDEGHGISIDTGGNVIITGYTQSTDFSTGAVAGNSVFQSTLGAAGYYDAFVVKFNSSGSRLWSTYYGGNYNDMANGITTDLADNVIITGNTVSTNFPVGATAGNILFQAAHGGTPASNWDAFAVKFTSTGSRIWATHFGGSSNDEGHGITADLSGNIAITGFTTSTNLPVGATAPNIVFQAAYGGGTDAFVIKFSPAGARLWATYHGGNSWDWAYKCAADNNGNIYILGEWEDSTNGSFPMNTCALQKTFAGGTPSPEDWFVTKFNPSGGRICSTFIGGSGEDDLDVSYGGLATWQNYVYVTGCTSGGFPVTSAFQGTHAADAGAYDAAVGKFCGNSCGDNNSITPVMNTPASLCINSALSFTSTVTSTLTCDVNSYLYKWYFTGSDTPTSTQQNPGSILYSTPGTYTVSLVVDGICSRDSVYKSITISSCNTCNLSTSLLSTDVSCGSANNGSVKVTATGGTAPFTYSWSNGTTAITNSITSQISSLTTGTYSVIVTDANGCTATGSTIIHPSLKVQFIKGTVNCSGCGCKQWIMVTASEGSTPYSYSWPGGYSNRYQDKLCPGAYTVKVTDKNGCSINVIVNAP